MLPKLEMEGRGIVDRLAGRDLHVVGAGSWADDEDPVVRAGFVFILATARANDGSEDDRTRELLLSISVSVFVFFSEEAERVAGVLLERVDRT